MSCNGAVVCPVTVTAFDIKSEDNRMAAAGSSQCGTDRRHCHGCADDWRQRRHSTCSTFKLHHRPLQQQQFDIS